MNHISVQSPVAYLCAEFGLSADLPFYAGGLGILAGDILKAAADRNFPFVGVGLLYKGKLAQSAIDERGWQQDVDRAFDPVAEGIFPVLFDGKPLTVQVTIASQRVTLSVHERIISSTVSLILLDPDTPENSPETRRLADILYCCDDHSQLQQAILLGCGGYKALKAMGLSPSVYHFNEGRPAFLIWEYVADIIATQALSFEDAWQEAKKKIVYTNHTLVAAGNQTYSADLIQPYALPYAEKCHCQTDQLLAQGQDIPKPNSGLSITRLALNASRKASGVSMPHTKLAQKAWPEYSWINITNGVHQETWQKPEFRKALQPPELWNAHRQYKHQLMELAVERTGIGYNPDTLVIAWARRITSYKQLDSIFNDLQRLESILRNPARPVQLVVAGKTHPGDENAKKMLQQVIQLFQSKLSGTALFLPNYDIPLAQSLVAGVDIWLNTPKFGMEASGTSGMKAASNGVLQATVADGWSAEVSWENLGWTLDSQQPELTLYDLLEQEIAPLFYDRNQAGLPTRWIERMSKTIELTDHYSAARVLREYREHLYLEK